MVQKRLVTEDSLPALTDEALPTLIPGLAPEIFSAIEDDVTAKIAAGAGAISSPTHLDIWDESASMTTTYATWISEIDALLDGKAEKTTAGTGSGSAARPVYAYIAGSGLKHVLLIGGQHGFEVYGQYAARAFFVAFATSGDPAMIALRQQITVVYVPTAVPHSFALYRSNANGVDINRNYGWNWGKFVAADKGADPLDQPEPLIIKGLMDDYPIELLIDCHSMEETADDLFTATAGPLIHNKRSVVERALAMWRLANPDAPEANYYTLGKSNPSLRNWAQKYLRFDKQRPAAQAVLIECRAQLGDSPAGTFNRQGTRWYASLIYNHILAWLQFGQVDEQIPNFTWIGSLNISDGSGTDVEITEGGRKISSTTYAPVKFLVTSGANNRSSIVVPIRHPGRYVALAKVNLEAPSGGGTIRVLGGLAFLSDSTGNVMPLASSVSSRRLAAGEIGTLELMASWPFASVPADTLYEMQVLLRVETAGQVALVRPFAGVNVQVTASPAFEPFELPVTT